VSGCVRFPAVAVRLLTLGALVLPACPEALAAADPRVLVLLSRDGPPYTQALAGLRESLARSAVALQVETVSGNAALAGGGGTDETRLILALGSAAGEMALRAPSRQLPLVAALVVKTDALLKAGNATGVGMEFPLDVQVAWLRRAFPRARRIAVLYNPGENAQRVDEARALAARAGFRLDAFPVRSPQEIPATLEEAARHAEVLWGLTDSVVFSPETAKGLLLFSFRNRIPLVGVSAAWVRAGALCSLDRDYVDLGRQAGEMALRILAGGSAAAIAPAAPRRACSAVNLRTARELGVELPEQLVREACEVVR
jgi:putative ABC transport system substrate-binding protein